MREDWCSRGKYVGQVYPEHVRRVEQKSWTRAFDINGYDIIEPNPQISGRLLITRKGVCKSHKREILCEIGYDIDRKTRSDQT